MAPLLVLGGCALAPEPIHPAPPIAQAWPSSEDGVALAARRAAWREMFPEPALAELISLALANNRDLRGAIQRVEIARGRLGIQRSALYPDVTLGSDAARSRVPAYQSLSGRPATYDAYTASVGAGWELDLWGRVHDLSTAALETWLATDEARRAVSLTLITDVANTWLVNRELDEQIMLAGRSIATRRESARIARRRFEVGAAPELDATQADSLLGEAETTLTALSLDRERTGNALILLIGTPRDSQVIPLSAIEDGMTRDLPAGLPSALLTGRPDIRGAEHRLRAAEANIGAARAAFFPRISLTGDYGTASTALSGLFTPAGAAWTMGAGLSAPLFDGGRNRGGLDVAKGERALAVAEYEHAIQGAFRDVADALAARRWRTLETAARRRTLAALTARAGLADLRYRNGASAYLEVLDAQRALFTAEQGLVEARRARLSAEVTLYAALGGGDDDPSAVDHMKDGPTQ